MIKATLVEADPIVKLELSLAKAQLIRDITGSISGAHRDSEEIWGALTGLKGLSEPKVMLEKAEGSQPNFRVVPYKRKYPND